MGLDALAAPNISRNLFLMFNEPRVFFGMILTQKCHINSALELHKRCQKHRSRGRFGPGVPN